ncbi:MAG: dicarboxylate/amino acid:cation symporter [Pseudomonadota bacterium]
MKRNFLLIVILAMVAGVVAGAIIHAALPPDVATSATAGFDQVTTIFLRLIKMIVSPLVFTTLVSGIGHIDGARSVGRIAAKAMAVFMTASLVALLMGLFMVNLLEPGVGVGLHQGASAAPLALAQAQGLGSFIEHLVPNSMGDALARNEILQVVVMSLFMGVAISSLGDKAGGLLKIFDQGAVVILKVTTYVMLFAPAAIFAAMASVISTQGLTILATYAKLIGDLYLTLALLIAGMFAIGLLLLKGQIRDLVRAVRSPALIAFSTSTSEAAFPLLLENLEAIGLPPKVVSFVLPLGYSFNLIGATMYCTFALMFVAQAYGIEVPISRQFYMVLVLMVTSKGIAGVPRASLVVIASALPFFQLPEGGLVLLLAVDHLMDMGRSATNVIGNGLAAAVVARWERIEARPAGVVPAIM